MKHIRVFPQALPVDIVPGILGIALGVFPQIATTFLAILGTIGFRHPTRLLVTAPRDWPLSLLALSLGIWRAWHHWHVNRNPWLGLFEGVFMWLMCLGTQQLKVMGSRPIAPGILVGLIISVAAATWPLVTPSITSTWYPSENNSFRLEKQPGFERFFALDATNTGVISPFDLQGPGPVRYTLEVRADAAITINISLLHNSIKNGRRDVLCAVDVKWKQCEIDADLTTRDNLAFAFGGYDSWHMGKPALEVRFAKLHRLGFPPVFEIIRTLPRVSGWAFNPNALGVWVVIGLVGILVLARSPWIMLTSLPVGLVGIALSGSRNAALAFLFGMLAWVTGHLDRRWIFASVLMAASVLILPLVTVFSPGRTAAPAAIPVTGASRALSLNDPEGIQVRYETFRLAFDVWRQSPLFGVGDLKKAMQANVDDQARAVGIEASNITHAHNLWLQVAGEGGILALVLMVALWGMVIRRVWRNRDRGALALLVVVAVANSLDYLFLYSPLQVAFWLAAAGLNHTVTPKDDQLPSGA